ncbi:two component system sensor kinase SsrA, partial [Salmonella enterica subsp. enterica serovar Typhimurium]|nr:two component system sensor kinase SsrA [Salmonella enterica subsp. enterica serovar Typhimurium]
MWLLSVLTAAYISMVQKRQHIIEDLSVLSEMNIVLSNQRFEEAERDAKNLMYQCSLATEIHHNDIFPEVSRHLSVGPSNCTPTLNGEKHRLFLQSSDIDENSFRRDSFILNHKNEISLLSTDNPSDYSTLQPLTRKSFPLYPTHAGFYWSEPEYINGKGWH